MRVVYFDLDSMRASHFGCYGYPRATTPNMDAVAAEGARFNRCYATDSPCVPSRAALFSGRIGLHNGVAAHWGPAAAFRFPGLGHGYDRSAPMFMRHLRQQGTRTISFSSFADRHQAFWFSAGWSEQHVFTLKGGNEDANEVNAAVLPWLEAHAEEENYFLHVHYWDPHRHYTMPNSWRARFANDPPPPWPDAAAIEAHRELAGPFTPTELYPWGRGRSPVENMPDEIRSVEDFKHFVDGYDGAVRFLDEHVGRVLDLLRSKGIYDESMIIISGDHGEAMGEFGVYGDHVCGAECINRIPMILRGPGIAAGQVRDDLVHNVDLPPTLCEHLGIPVPEGWDGKSFAAALEGGQDPGRDHLVWSHGLYSVQRAVRTPRWNYLRTYHPGLFAFEPRALYDMAADPFQTRNVVDAHPEVARDLELAMEKWKAERQEEGDGPDPLEIALSEGPWNYLGLDYWLDRLCSHGRSDKAQIIEKRIRDWPD
ncbi:MAG: sulfatase [Myxococcota bacterium]